VNVSRGTSDLEFRLENLNYLSNQEKKWMIGILLTLNKSK